MEATYRLAFIRSVFLPSRVESQPCDGCKCAFVCTIRFDGASEQAVIRCARIALGLRPGGTAHLVNKCGDIVDLSQPIEDGDVLYLDAPVQKFDATSVFGHEGVHKRTAPVRKASTWSGDVSRTERESSEEDERRPLLRPSGSSTEILESSTSGTIGDVESVGKAVEGPEQQRWTLVKLKRILAHLANERTFLAWVRVSAKLFSAGVLSLSLASSTSGFCALTFAFLGFIYFSLAPYLVFVGLRRFRAAAFVMQGSVHDAFDFFTGHDMKVMTMILSGLSMITVLLLVLELVASV